MKAIELQPKRSTYNQSPLGKNNNNISKSGTARLSRTDSKSHVDDAALASVTYDLEVQKLQEEEEKGSNTFFARICSNIGNKIWENTNSLREVLYSPEWTSIDLQNRLIYSSWIQFVLNLLLAIIGIAIAPFPSFAVVSAVPLGLSLISPILVHLFVTTSSVRAEKPSLILFALAFIALLAPAFGGVSISIVTTFFSTHGTAHGPWWSFWVFMQTIVSVTFGFSPGAYSFLLLLQLQQGRVRRELGNDLLTTSTTIQAGLLAVARTTDKVIEKHVRDLRGMIEVGGDEIAQLEKIVFDLCLKLGLEVNHANAGYHLGDDDDDEFEKETTMLSNVNIYKKQNNNDKINTSTRTHNFMGENNLNVNNNNDRNHVANGNIVGTKHKDDSENNRGTTKSLRSRKVVRFKN